MRNHPDTAFHPKRPAARRLAVLAVLACAGSVALAAGCGGDDDDADGSGQSETETTAEAPQTDVTIGESSPVASNPNQQAITYGMNEAAAQLGWSVQTLDADLSPDKQVTDVDDFIARKVKGIASWTLDPGAADAAYQRADKAKIPIVGFNSESPFIATEVAQQTDTSCEPGQDAAAYIAERIPNANVLVIGGPPVPSIELRVECFTDAANEEDLEVLEQQDNVKDTAATAQPIVQDLLTKHPDTDAIFAYNDPSALGAAAVVQNAGENIWSGDDEGVIVIGMNGSVEAIDAIKAGSLTATYDGNSPDAGAAAIAALATHVGDGEPISAMPKEVVIEATRYDAENADDYIPPLEREVSLDAGGGSG